MSITSFTIFMAILIQICFLGMVISTDYPSDLLVTRLIHHHSVHYPFYDPAKTIEDIVKNDLEVTRAHYMKESSSFLPAEIESPLLPKDRHGFLAVLEIGEKNVTQFLYMDTGSSLLWVNCEPCGLNVPGLLYHPVESSTYRAENCMESRFCASTGAVTSWCGLHERCHYEQRFVGGETSSGHLAIETFKFGTQKSILKDIVFGCTAKTNLYVNGVLGLGPNHVSLVSQTLSTKFSYCIGNISDRFYQHNTLIMGDKLELHDTQTPMVIEDKYYITLESIKVGDKKLEIDSRIFMRESDDYTGGMVIDSGTTYSFLPQAALDKLEEEIENVIDFNLVRNLSIPIPWLEKSEMLCYSGILNRDLKGFPKVTLEFKDNAVMELGIENVFKQYDHQNFCLAVFPSESLGLGFSIMGNLMQQYYYVTFDLVVNKVSFTSVDCSYLDDYIGDEL